MAYVNPIWLEGRRRYWERHDAHRFRKPDGSEYKSYATRLIAQRQAEEEEARAAAEQEAFEQEVLALRREVKKLKLEYELWRFQQKYRPDQPRAPKGDPKGGQWTKEGGGDPGKDGRSDRLQSRDAELRRGSPRPVGTPQQNLRLDIVSVRAREAVARVQQLDPNWRPQSLTSRDSATNMDVMIRAKEAETREADARFIALSRAGQDDAYPRRDAPTTAEVLAPHGQFVGGRMPNVPETTRTLAPGQFEEIRFELMGGARRVEPGADYDGVWYRRQDGSVVGLRMSRDHGLTLEVIESNHPLVNQRFKVHQR